MTHRSTNCCLGIRIISVSFLSLALSAVACAQQDRVAEGIDLLKKFDPAGAAKLLREATKQNEDNLAAWHYLGLASERLGKKADALRAHERTVNLGVSLPMRALNSPGRADFDAVIAQIKPELKLAAESADDYVRLSRDLSKTSAQEWNDLRGFFRAYLQYPKATELAMYKPKELTTQPRILFKPEPSYTDVAKMREVKGTVILSAIFTGDGKVQVILPITRLPYGLTANAISAAQRIRFVPATRDGLPVSTRMQLEYNFSLY